MQAACQGSATTSEDTDLKQGPKAKAQTVIPLGRCCRQHRPWEARRRPLTHGSYRCNNGRRNSSLPLASDPKTIRSDVAKQGASLNKALASNCTQVQWRLHLNCTGSVPMSLSTAGMQAVGILRAVQPAFAKGAASSPMRSASKRH